MFISIDEKALSWFSEEFEINRPLSIRLYPQYAGFGQQHKGYSIGFSVETPTNAEYSKAVNDITFYVECSDIWFFNDIDTYLFIDNQTKELQILFHEDETIVKVLN
jgi:uncharacterized protein YneR